MAYELEVANGCPCFCEHLIGNMETDYKSTVLHDHNEMEYRLHTVTGNPTDIMLLEIGTNQALPGAIID